MQPMFFRIASRVLALVGLDTATTGFRLWTSDRAPWLAFGRPVGGFAVAFGRREVVVSRR
jgi:hypothetical protein